jgi:hypothetical protein
VKACLQWLALHKIKAWKMNTGAFIGKSGHLVRAGFPGCPDILGVVRPTGRFLGVECKTGRAELNDDQTLVEIDVIHCGGIFIVARSVDDLEALVRER